MLCLCVCVCVYVFVCVFFDGVFFVSFQFCLCVSTIHVDVLS